MNPAYLRKTDTNECFAFNPFLAKRQDMVPWNGPLPWEGVIAEKPVNPTADGHLDENERLELIKRAIKDVPEEKWGQSVGQEKPQPRVKDVSKAVGFKVAASEITQALEG